MYNIEAVVNVEMRLEHDICMYYKPLPLNVLGKIAVEINPQTLFAKVLS